MDPRRVERRRLEPREIGAGSTGHYGLPLDVIETAVRRLGFLGLVIALMGPSAYVFELLTQPVRVTSGRLPLALAAAIFLAIAGTAICVSAWSGRVRPELVLDIGLVFQVTVAFTIAISEGSSVIPPEHPIDRISWNCLWISMYVVAIPGTYGKVVCAAMAAACMAPFGLLVATTANGNQPPGTPQFLALVLPPFAAALWAIPVGRYLYRLGAQVSKARAMGSYELVELLGRGGMGEVWLARHRMLARAAAIKLIRPQGLAVETGADARTIQKRFEREAMATAELRSPNTVVLYDYGVSEDGVLYYVMELLDGLDLQQLVNEFGPQPASRVLHLMHQAAKSLAEAHERGLIHRDVKPSNIFCCRMGIDYDHVKVLDFGLVKIRSGADNRTQLTRAGVTTGTPAYMAPEVLGGSAETDGRADLYSLGCVAYFLLTGHLVFEASGAMAMAMAHVQTPPVPPSQRSELRIPDEVERIVMACLEKDPGRRPQTARALAAMLSSCGDDGQWTRDDAERWWLSHMPGKGHAEAATGGAAPSTVLMPSETI